jgi:hypothetical protein
MHIALADLRLDSLDVIHAGEHTFPIGEKVRALSCAHLLKELAPLHAVVAPRRKKREEDAPTSTEEP